MAGETDSDGHADSDATSDFPTPALLPGARAIIWLDITRVGTSCGYSVPFMKFERHRTFPSPPSPTNPHTKKS